MPRRLGGSDLQTILLGGWVEASEEAKLRISERKRGNHLPLLWFGKPNLSNQYIGKIVAVNVDGDGELVFTIQDPHGSLFSCFKEAFVVLVPQPGAS